ncbi:ribose-5-phosphate isomerase RpiA [Algimonas porphyrae]|uniref:Ribose-5-phosphate isomerase A n=1 Tax=Algimonas porphyrae TaxID=1128113 RepID=A0ABQ5UWS5_9PROT|nr:ribose-5-phosphate isomerase RpiA [Algimonas porphyrae]GLQ19165.1 ribose-5-phosphate isomerase A [Algimonas porphyrae]
MSIAKENAAQAALEFVQDGMVLGLGSGSTAEIFIEKLGDQVAGGLKVTAIPTSQRTAQCAIEAGITLLDPDRVDHIDLTIDGADEVDQVFQLIKGGGACLLREKIVAQASRKMVVIVDDRKMVETLGTFPLPVEVDPFCLGVTAQQVYDALMATGCEDGQTVLRQMKDGSGPLVTDGGHYILDCRCRRIPDPVATARALAMIPGVMETGLFIDLASTIIVGEVDHAKVLEIRRETSS